ncbi:hypothetical protein V5O48_010828 [Marasmius crinis-equi]|uniref:ABC transmembrane type-1 domain-containing protein n=1 Tax=Marasmius crinis-equi TaxID=585013 RepID=A0ABR3F7A8_9AGAR
MKGLREARGVKGARDRIDFRISLFFSALEGTEFFWVMVPIPGLQKCTHAGRIQAALSTVLIFTACVLIAPAMVAILITSCGRPFPLAPPAIAINLVTAALKAMVLAVAATIITPITTIVVLALGVVAVLAEVVAATILVLEAVAVVILILGIVVAVIVLGVIVVVIILEVMAAVILVLGVVAIVASRRGYFCCLGPKPSPS